MISSPLKGYRRVNYSLFFSLIPGRGLLLKGNGYKAGHLESDWQQTQPEKLLVLAMLRRAYCDALGEISDRDVGKAVKHEAREWLFDDSGDVHTASWWCEFINGEHILRDIRKLLRQKDDGNPGEKNHFRYRPW